MIAVPHRCFSGCQFRELIEAIESSSATSEAPLNQMLEEDIEVDSVVFSATIRRSSRQNVNTNGYCSFLRSATCLPFRSAFVWLENKPSFFD